MPEVDLEDVWGAAGLEAHRLATVLGRRRECVAGADQHADRAASAIQIAEVGAVEAARELIDALEDGTDDHLVPACHDH